MAQKKKMSGKRKRRKQKRAALLFLLLVFFIFACLMLFVFRLRKIEIIKNQYSSDREIADWLGEDKLSSNTIYLWWKYNRDGVELLPSMADISVKLRSPWEAEVNVTEKKFIGRIDWNGSLLYFDMDGIVSLQSADIIGGVPYIEGLSFDASKVKMGEKLPVEDDDVFQGISKAAEEMEQYILIPDKISCNGGDLTLHFGGIRAQIGDSGYEEKIAQIPPILQKMFELYGGQGGVLHLENYDGSSSIRFVPDTAAADQAGQEEQ